MRQALALLSAFVVGVLLTLWLPGHLPTSSSPLVEAPAVHSPTATSNPPAPATSATDGNETADPGDNWPLHAPSPEQVLYAQPRMLREALAKLTPRITGRPNLYVLTFAGDGGEDVFRNEAEYAARLFPRRFGPSAHALVLENNPATLATHPLASWSNLEAALDGLEKVMRPDQDILMLYLTSHGDEDHNLLVDMDPLPLDQIGAADLAGILARRPFKWKVIVVSACYSGGFIPPLRGPGTLVLTAARTDRSSFGCGSDSHATYFGRAWLIDAMNRTPDVITAFRQARTEIAGWERRDKLTPSEPQIDIGTRIEAQLMQWRKGLPSGPVVPFEPAKPAITADHPSASSP
jgi:hypothetical protein